MIAMEPHLLEFAPDLVLVYGDVNSTMATTPSESAVLSEASLSEDWSRPEEDAAWAHVQPPFSDLSQTKLRTERIANHIASL